MATTPKTPMADKPVQTRKAPAIRVVPMTGRDTYRAIGRAFARCATDIPLDELTDAEVKKLRSDPHLSATDVEIDVPVTDDSASAD
jgi:hypothetical protein